MSKIRIFVASPGDVTVERDIVATVVVPELRRIFDNRELRHSEKPVELEAIRWETHSWPDVGEDAQDVINNQLTEFDILVGIMWKRFGSPTKRSQSGTGEEFERAYRLYEKFKKPRIMFYFRVTPFYLDDNRDLSQFRKVLAFRRKLEALGVLYWRYVDALQFERDVREHLLRQILQLSAAGQTEEATASSASLQDGKRSSEIVLSPKPGGYRPRVFLSYATEDVRAVRDVYNLLRQRGFDPWLDTEVLLPGQNWRGAVNRAIRDADFILAFLSRAALEGRGFFHSEIAMALQKISELPLTDIYFIPVRLEAVEPPPVLREYHWVDIFSEQGLDQLIGSMWKVWRSRH
jgi:hypothetical protein